MEARGVPVRYLHMQGEEQWGYNDGLAALCGPDVARTLSWRRRMYAGPGEEGRKRS